MNISMGFAAPMGVLAAVVGGACWSHVGAEAPAPPRMKAEAFPEALLTPVLGVESPRDPFRLPGAAEPAKPKPSRNTKPSESLLARIRRALARPVSKSVAVIGRAVDDKRAATRAALKNLPLAGTSVGLDRSVAILAGQVYAEGETIAGLDASHGHVVLAQVRPAEVVLRSAAGDVVVGFPGHGTASASSAVRPNAKPPAAAAKRPASRKKAATTTPTMKGNPR